MSNELELYHNILFIDRPWLDTTTSGQKYQQMFHALSKEHLAQQPLYDFAFPRPLTPKRKYYYTLFDNEANRYINTIHTLINQASNDNEKKYWIHPTLTKKLKDKLTQIEAVIKNNSFLLFDIYDRNKEQKHTDDAYIMQCLKYQLIRLYIEIQDSFPAYVKEDTLTQEDIHKLYFSEPAPINSFIVPAKSIDFPKPSTAIIVKPQEQTFEAIKGDIREDQKGVLNYADIVAKPDSFASAEEEFFNSELLDHQYKFIKKRGNVEKMAALYHLLIQKQHFKSHSFKGGKKKITDLEIRKFLNHRYIAKIDKEFRNFKDKTTLDNYLNNHITLSLLIRS